MRKRVCLWTVIVLLVVGLAVVVAACGGNSAGNSSTTLGSAGVSSTAAGETTTTAASGGTTTTAAGGGTTTTAAGGGTTTTSAGGSTTTTEEETTTTVAQTTDTADHSAELRSFYPSTESFNNSNWATLNAAPASHLGAAVDVTGQPSNVAVDPDSRYLTWTLTVTGTGGEQMTALCRTNVTIDRSLLTAGTPVEVKGLVVGVQAADAGGGPIIYAESVQKAS